MRGDCVQINALNYAPLRFGPFSVPLLRFLPRMCFYIPPARKVRLWAVSVGGFSLWAVFPVAAAPLIGNARRVKQSKAAAVLPCLLPVTLRIYRKTFAGHPARQRLPYQVFL